VRHAFSLLGGDRLVMLPRLYVQKHAGCNRAQGGVGVLMSEASVGEGACRSCKVGVTGMLWCCQNKAWRKHYLEPPSHAPGSHP